MGGYSGSRMDPGTPHVTIGGQVLAVTAAQRRLVDAAVKGGGMVHVSGPQVRTARAIEILGSLRDDGKMGSGGNADGERWVFRLKEGCANGHHGADREG